MQALYAAHCGVVGVLGTDCAVVVSFEGVVEARVRGRGLKDDRNKLVTYKIKFRVYPEGLDNVYLCSVRNADAQILL